MVEYEEFELTEGAEQGYLLKTLLTMEAGQSAKEAFSQLVEALYGWVDARGAGFGALEITMLAPSEHHQALVTNMLSLVEQEVGLRDLFLEVGRVNVKFGESYESELSEFNIQVDADEESRAA